MNSKSASEPFHSWIHYVTSASRGNRHLGLPNTWAWAYMVPAQIIGGRFHFHGVPGFRLPHTDIAEVSTQIEMFLMKNWKLTDFHLDELDADRPDEWAGPMME